MEAIEELVQLSDSMRQAAAVLADEDVDNYKRPSTFLNVVALGNVVSFSCLSIINHVMCCIGSVMNEYNTIAMVDWIRVLENLLP